LESEAPQKQSLNRLDRFSIATGKLTSWLTLAMVVVTAVIVVMRYWFDAGFIWLQESVTWMHAVVFMVGAAYTLQQEEHVRVDIFYRAASDKGRAWVDLSGTIVFLFPFCAFLAYASYGYAAASWSLHESSRESGGLPYPLIPVLKSALLFMPIAVSLQGVSLFMKSVATIRRG
jgi:TRAP-type mannitol/chloroaromatic compound transport system permease small subunit